MCTTFEYSSVFIYNTRHKGSHETIRTTKLRQEESVKPSSFQGQHFVSQKTLFKGQAPREKSTCI